MTDYPQPPLFGESDDDLPPDPLPDVRMGDRTARIYVASALTRLKDDPKEARMVEGELHAITQAVTSLERDGGLELAVEPYAPIEHSSAHRHDDLKPEEVFQRNSLQVLANSDGAIIYGWEPSAGVGQEFAWATTQACIPVLWIQHGEHAVSRQILGTPGDVSFQTFDRPGDLGRIVQDWLRSRRPVLNAGPYKRAARELRWRGPVTAARGRWTNLDSSEKDRVAALGNVAPDVIDFYLSDPLLLAAAPTWIMELLTVEGLLVATSGSPSTRGQLATSQFLGLAEAATEYDWGTDVVDHLRRAAEELLAEPATRRLKLETPADWARFRRSLEA